MSFRARLTLFFLVIVIVPLLVAGAAVQAAISREVEHRTGIRLSGEAKALAAAWLGQAGMTGRDARAAAVALAPALRDGSRASVEAVGAEVGRLRERTGLDYLVVRLGDGTLVSSMMRPAFLPGAPPMTARWLVQAGPGSALVIAADVAVRARSVDASSGSVPGTSNTPLPEVAHVYAGRYLDQPGAAELSASAGGVQFEVTAGGTVVGSTVTPVPLPPARSGVVALPDGRRAMFTAIGASPSAPRPDAVAVLVARDDAVSSLRGAILIVLFASVLIASIMGFGLARLLSEPLRRLADQATELLPTEPESNGRKRPSDEVSLIADSFSVMNEHIHVYETELTRSRDELRRSLERLGSTLRATHDLHGMLSVVLDSAVATLRARAGAVYVRQGSEGKLWAEVSVGSERAGPEIRWGEGIAGTAAEERRPVLSPSPGGPLPAAGEPPDTTAVAVPLVQNDRALGVLALYGRVDGASFTQDDALRLASFAEQAAVAVDNVLRHQEVERLSVTDALTGVGNRRFLEFTLTREIERARRYGRSLAVMLSDIDRFKAVNDELGHQRGDQVLVGVTRIIESSIRVGVDTLVRYGGEEFLVVLPETDHQGAVAAAERVRHDIAAGAFGRRKRGPLRITVSIGVATFPEDGDSAEELIRAADRAMYWSKRRGRNQVSSHPEPAPVT